MKPCRARPAAALTSRPPKKPPRSDPDPPMMTASKAISGRSAPAKGEKELRIAGGRPALADSAIARPQPCRIGKIRTFPAEPKALS